MKLRKLDKFGIEISNTVYPIILIITIVLVITIVVSFGLHENLRNIIPVAPTPGGGDDLINVSEDSCLSGERAIAFASKGEKGKYDYIYFRNEKELIKSKYYLWNSNIYSDVFGRDKIVGLIDDRGVIELYGNSYSDLNVVDGSVIRKSTQGRIEIFSFCILDDRKICGPDKFNYKDNEAEFRIFNSELQIKEGGYFWKSIENELPNEQEVYYRSVKDFLSREDDNLNLRSNLEVSFYRGFVSFNGADIYLSILDNPYSGQILSKWFFDSSNNLIYSIDYPNQQVTIQGSQSPQETTLNNFFIPIRKIFELKSEEGYLNIMRLYVEAESNGYWIYKVEPRKVNNVAMFALVRRDNNDYWQDFSMVADNEEIELKNIKSILEMTCDE